MEEPQNQNAVRQLTFHGKGGEMLGLYLINFLLTVITLGLYYPWAKAAILGYLYRETEFEDSRFTFHGTGREMFVGFLKAIGIFFVLYGVLVACALSKKPGLLLAGVAFFYIGLLLLMPVAIHGSLRYRAAKSSWRGIHFGYRGELKELVTLCIKGALLTLITFGIYGAWFVVDIRKYVFKNLRFGSLHFAFVGRGSDYFFLHLKGYFLTIFTLGIYLFWYVKDLFAYYVDHTRMYQDEKRIVFRSTATAGKYFSLVVGNLLIILLTLGIGTPWAIARALHFVFDNIEIDGALDVNTIAQTEENYSDATGEDLADMIDIGLV